MTDIYSQMAEVGNEMFNPEVEKQMADLAKFALESNERQEQADYMALMDYSDNLYILTKMIDKALNVKDIKSHKDIEKASITFTGLDLLVLGRALVTTLGGIRTTRLLAAEAMMQNLVSSHTIMQEITAGAREPVTLEEALKT